MAFEPADDYNPNESTIKHKEPQNNILDALSVDLDSIKTPETESNNIMEDYENKFIKFVMDQITTMNSKLMFDGKSQPSLYQIDRALMQHEHVMLALTALYEQARWSLNAAKSSWEEWHAKRFLEIRTEVNKADMSTSKWYKESEIDHMITVKYAKEKAAFKAKITLADSKVSLFRRLIDSWNSYAFQLGQLSRNGIAEKNSNDLSGSYEDQDPVDLAKSTLHTYS